jgi:cyclase
MLKCRVIPILTFNGMGLVKTKGFAPNPRMVGNPIQAAKVFNSRNVDELVFLDIYASDQNRKINLQMVKSVTNECFMPVGVGGGIRTIDDIHDLLSVGADKVVLKSRVLDDFSFINEAADVFGNQCITLAIDAVKEGNEYYIYNRQNRRILLLDFLKSVSGFRFGEIILTSVNNDGMMKGFDIELVKLVESIITVPIIASGGAGEPGHYRELFSETNIEAVASSSIFFFTRYTPYDIKIAISSVGRPVRLVEKHYLPNNQ